ncbi:MAG: ABC transporter permease [Thermoplasmata archaeon]
MGVARFLGKRALYLGITFVVASYVVVVIANFGGLIDEFLINQIRIETLQEMNNDEQLRRLQAQCPECWNDEFDQRVADRIEARGLNEPFLQKSFRQTAEAITLQLGKAVTLKTGTGSQALWDHIAERLPRTVLLFTTATVTSAVLGIWLGLRMARRALSTMDRSFTVLSITTFVVPSWIFGILFLLIFAFYFRVVPPGGMVSAPAPTDPFLFSADLGFHLLLPLVTVTFSSFGSWSYITRNLVLQIMDEDYVTAARTKGLPEKVVLNKYVLRAASPPIVTSLALALIASWTGAIITELVFNWPGLGLLYWNAILVIDPPIIIGLTVVYAFLFVITIFILDVIYSFLDPRIKALGR